MAKVKITAETQVDRLAKKMSKQGVTPVAIKNVYGSHAMQVLGSLFDRQRDNRYTLKKGGELPTLEKFSTLLHEMYDVNATSAIECAITDLKSLGEECREIVENASEGLQQTQRIQTFNDTADTLECLDDPDFGPFAEMLKDVKVCLTPSTSHRTGRAHRCGEIISDARTAVDAIQEFIDTHNARPKVQWTLDPNKLEELADLLSDVTSALDDADGCEFPGMYG